MDISSIIYPAISLGGLGLIFGVGLGYAAKKFAVEVDPKIPLIKDVLPGANCGACGYTGCEAYAKAIVGEGVATSLCPVGGSDVIGKVADIMGVEAVEMERTVAIVKCKGDCNVSKDKYKYDGIMDCVEAANTPGGGPKSCSYGCLGLGTCVKACQFNAINIVDGIAIIDEEKCTACESCVAVCPKNVIEMMPAEKRIKLKCNSNDMGKDVKSTCEVGCIGCRICVKSCPKDAFTFENNLPKIDYDKCIQCGICEKKCPTNVFEFVKKSAKA